MTFVFVLVGAFLAWPLFSGLRQHRPDYKGLALYVGALALWIVIDALVNYDYPCSVEDCF